MKKRGRSPERPPFFIKSRRLERDLAYQLNQPPGHARSLKSTVDARRRGCGCIDLSEWSDTSLQVIFRSGEVSMVEQVEEISPEGEFESLSEREILHEASVHVKVARATIQIPA